MAKKQKTDPRSMMELAIKQMRLSVNDIRKDGKTNPLVGAVLVRKDGTVDMAHRGELRQGDHAEFGLLERKNSSKALDGAVLYSTLEPCAPGSRKYPKLGCAERIVLARIKEVYVGIEDPDPTVDRKGILYLQEHGVNVEMFDRDLQEVINEENKAFIEQALVRAATAKEKPQEMVLSPLEKRIQAVNTKDLDPSALAAYRFVTFGNRRSKTEDFERALVQQGILLEEKGQIVPSGFGALLFGRRPRSAMQQAGLLGTIRYPNGTEETRDFDGPLVAIPAEVETWLRDKLPNVLDRDQMKARSIDALPFVLVREAVVNALVHRDYSISGAKCQLIVSADSIVVKSPGKPIEPITMEQMQTFEAPMLSRNPLMHYVFRRLGLAEERGLGLDSMKRRAREFGLPSPSYAWKNPYLELTIHLNAQGMLKNVLKGTLAKLTDEERRGWNYLSTQDRTTVPEYATHMGVTVRTAQRHLAVFTKMSLLSKEGKARATFYRVHPATRSRS